MKQYFGHPHTGKPFLCAQKQYVMEFNDGGFYIVYEDGTRVIAPVPNLLLEAMPKWTPLPDNPFDNPKRKLEVIMYNGDPNKMKAWMRQTFGVEYNDKNGSWELDISIGEFAEKWEHPFQAHTDKKSKTFSHFIYITTYNSFSAR